MTLPPGSIQKEATFGTSSSYDVQASVNLTNWIVLATNAAPFTFQDAIVTNTTMRVYRSFIVPDPASSAILGD